MKTGEEKDTRKLVEINDQHRAIYMTVVLEENRKNYIQEKLAFLPILIIVIYDPVFSLNLSMTLNVNGLKYCILKNLRLSILFLQYISWSF